MMFVFGIVRKVAAVVCLLLFIAWLLYNAVVNHKKKRK